MCKHQGRYDGCIECFKESQLYPLENLREDIKKFLIENIEIVIEYETKHSVGDNQIVGLKFKGDKDCFTKNTVYIS